VAAVLVHIDLDGEQPHPSSLAALAAGRATASSWGATLYAAVVVHDAMEGSSAADSTAQIVARKIAGIDGVRGALAKAGADKVIVGVSDAPVSPLWASVGVAWQSILDHLRPRLVLFGADAPSAPELGPRTGARIGARLLLRARAVGDDQIELRDRDGGYARLADGGAAVALIGAGRPSHEGDDEIDIVALVVPGGADARIELAGTAPAELAHTLGTIVAIGDDAAADPEVLGATQRLARLIGAHVVGGPAAVRAGLIAPGAVVERHTPLAPELCVAIGTPALDLAGATSLVQIGPAASKTADGALAGPPGPSLVELVRALERS
jgi:hypothetical protein